MRCREELWDDGEAIMRAAVKQHMKRVLKGEMQVDL